MPELTLQIYFPSQFPVHKDSAFSNCAMFFLIHMMFIQCRSDTCDWGKSGLYSSGSHFVLAFGGYVSYQIECCEEGDDDEGGQVWLRRAGTRPCHTHRSIKI